MHYVTQITVPSEGVSARSKSAKAKTTRKWSLFRCCVYPQRTLPVRKGFPATLVLGCHETGLGNKGPFARMERAGESLGQFSSLTKPRADIVAANTQHMGHPGAIPL